MAINYVASLVSLDCSGTAKLTMKTEEYFLRLSTNRYCHAENITVHEKTLRANLNHDRYLDHYAHTMKVSSEVLVLRVVISWVVKAKKREKLRISSSTATAIFLSNDVFSLIWIRLVLVATMATVPGKYQNEACMACKMQWKGCISVFEETNASASNH